VDKKILSNGERDFLMDVRKRTLEIISVDDFDLEEIQAGLTARGDQIRSQRKKKAA